MREVFNALFQDGYAVQKRKDNSFYVILPTGSKYEIFDNGNDCICIGSYVDSYDYQDTVEGMVEKVLGHVKSLR